MTDDYELYRRMQRIQNEKSPGCIAGLFFFALIFVFGGVLVMASIEFYAAIGCNQQWITKAHCDKLSKDPTFVNPSAFLPRGS